MFRLYLITESDEWLHPHQFCDRRNAESLGNRWVRNGKCKSYRIE